MQRKINKLAGFWLILIDTIIFVGHFLHNRVLFFYKKSTRVKPPVLRFNARKQAISTNAENDGLPGGFEQLPTRTVRVILDYSGMERSRLIPVRSAPFYCSNESSEAQMKMNFVKAIFAVAIAVLMCIAVMPSAIAQTVTGSITGTVTDQSDAVVPGARVVAHNLDTGVDSSTATNATGSTVLSFCRLAGIR